METEKSDPIAVIRHIITKALAGHGIEQLEDDQRIFSSGLLDSLSAVELLTRLETDFDLNLADADFDINRIDTLGSIKQLIATRGQ